MIQRVFLLVSYNLYGTKRYFTEKLAEAFQRKGIETAIKDSQKGWKIEDLPKLWKKGLPDFTCSFNRVQFLMNGGNLGYNIQAPHLSMIVDPLIYEIPITESPYAAMTCVDYTEYQMMLSKGYDKILFWPHAIERELALKDYEDRPYDVVMIGSCYDPENLKAHWQRKYSDKICKVIDDALDICFSDPKMHFIFAVDLSLNHHGLQASEVDYLDLIYYVDNYMRGVDRVELLRAIKEIPVHVFGGTCWRKEHPIEGWQHYLADMPNMHLHPAISFQESLEILKKSKICLNSVPSFKNGTHERVFASFACGAVPITTESLYLRDHFEEGKEIFFYRMQNWGEVNHVIKDLLKDEKKRKDIAEKGRANVLENHTWDVRVDQLLRELPPILGKINRFISG